MKGDAVSDIEVIGYRALLPGPLFGHLQSSALALAEQQYLASAVWGAVFLEGFMDVLCHDLAMTPPSLDDLNARIQQLRQYNKNRGADASGVPDEIIKRCDDIRNTRNRLVHHTGLAKQTLRQDAEFIGGGLGVILEWYRSRNPVFQPEAPYPTADQPGGVPVFLSTITPHTHHQVIFIEMLRQRLREIGIEPVRLPTAQFGLRDPVGRAADTVRRCRALIAVGLERSHAYFLREKEGGDGQTEETHRRYTSGWLHLEAGIAHALGLPVFVLCQRDLCSDGIFDRSWNSYGVTELSTLDVDSPPMVEFLSQLQQWAEGQGNAATC